MKKKLIKYRLQLLFAAFFILTYTSYIPIHILIDKNNAITFSQLEIVGAKMLLPMESLLISTQKLRGLTASYKAGNSSLLVRVQQQTLVVEAKLQDAKEAVAKANLKRIAPLFASLSLKLQNIMSVALSQTAKEGFKNYTAVMNDELALIVKIGDMSNLVLDSGLDTSYLVDTVVNKLPLTTETVRRLRMIGGTILASKKGNKDTGLRLAILLGSLENNIVSVKNDLDSAYLYNNSLKPVIYFAFEKLFISANKFEDETKKIIKGNFLANPKKYFQTATDVINNTTSLYDISDRKLLQLLNIRVEKMKAVRDRLIIEGIIFLLILMALFYIAYSYLHKNLVILTYSLTHDNLTGMYNRNSLVNDIKELNNNAIIMLIDIKAFKEINDVYGGDFGDRVLLQFTKHLEQFFAHIAQTTLYRIGGDEFAVLVTNKSVDEVMQIGKDLEEAISDQNFIIDNIRTNLSVNIAINSVAPLLENADLALKTAKKDMNIRVIEYNSNMNLKKEWQKNIEVINMVKSALEEDRIVPYFQGIVNLQTLKIEKYEALVRLILPSGEVLSPYFFLGIASKTHYYYDITKVMIKKTMEVARAHSTQRFSINFSMKDIINDNIHNILFELFDADKGVAKRIDIELLETELVVANDNRVNDFIKKVRSYGSKILIDDFGTGYSNFSYLSDLDVDILKIDASITKEIISNSRKLHILQTIHNFTSGMNMQNVAEFVETKEVALLLQKIGIEYAQGYYFSKPLSEPLENSEVFI